MPKHWSPTAGGFHTHLKKCSSAFFSASVRRSLTAEGSSGTPSLLACMCGARRQANHADKHVVPARDSRKDSDMLPAKLQFCQGHAGLGLTPAHLPACCRWNDSLQQDWPPVPAGKHGQQIHTTKPVCSPPPAAAGRRPRRHRQQPACHHRWAPPPAPWLPPSSFSS